MGSGAWSASAFDSYSISRGRKVVNGVVDGADNAQAMFVGRSLDSILNPYRVLRECRDSEEHPETRPVILALDVTGSMGTAAARVARQLNAIMTDLFSKVKDVEFMIMGIGDLAYDKAPLQVSQFESDIRIAEQLDKVYFERGGGGNGYESYTGAWYFALKHTDLDCWKRGKKGIIITLGDEAMNPYLPKAPLSRVTGDEVGDDIETADLYKQVCEKFDVYHLAVDDDDTCYLRYRPDIERTFKPLLGDHLRVVTLDSLSSAIVDIVANPETNISNNTTEQGISW